MFAQHAVRIVQHYAWMKLTPGMCRHSINDMPSEPWMRCRANWSRSHLVLRHSAVERNIIPMNVSVFVFNQEPNQPFYTVWVAHRISRNIKITDDEYDETASEQCNYDLEKKKQIYGRTMDGMNNIYRPLCYYDLMSVCIVDVDALYGMALVASSYTRHARISSSVSHYSIIAEQWHDGKHIIIIASEKKHTKHTNELHHHSTNLYNDSINVVSLCCIFLYQLKSKQFCFYCDIFLSFVIQWQLTHMR